MRTYRRRIRRGGALVAAAPSGRAGRTRRGGGGAAPASRREGGVGGGVRPVRPRGEDRKKRRRDIPHPGTRDEVAAPSGRAGSRMEGLTRRGRQHRSREQGGLRRAEAKAEAPR